MYDNETREAALLKLEKSIVNKSKLKIYIFKIKNPSIDKNQKIVQCTIIKFKTLVTYEMV